jgi:hypothetical protein
MLLRLAFLILLLLAFLRPVWNRFGGKTPAGGRQVLIVLDHSMSMGHHGDGPTAHERAIHEALKILETLATEDSVNVLLMDASPKTCFVEFSKDHAEAKRFLETLKPGLGRADINLANTLASRLLGKESPAAEVYYLSDFQRKNWANVNFSSLPPSARLFFVDVGAARKENRAILEARLSQSQVLAGDTVVLEVTLGNFSSEPFQGRVTIVLDRKFTFDQEVSLASWSEGKVLAPIPAGGPGVHMCEVKLPPDALEADNHFCLSLSVLEKEEVLIITDRASDPRGSAYFLKTALNPFEKEAGSLLPRIITPAEANPSRLAGVRKVFITQTGGLGKEACAALAKLIFQGGGVVLFLDGTADAANIADLERAMGPNTMPLRLGARRSATNVSAGAQQMIRGDFKSRYLRLFTGVARQNLSLLEFYDYYQAGSTGAGSVILSYGDESPAMGVVHHGLGTLLILNFSASEFSSNLARQRIFPAWMQDLIKALAADEPPPASFTIGETLHTEVWRSELRDQDFKDPSGIAVSPKRELSGERYRVSFVPEKLGFYTLGNPRPLYVFGVNGSPDEMDLRPIEKESLPKEFAAERSAHLLPNGADYEDLAKGKPLFHWFVLAALGFLVAESAFQLLLRSPKEPRAVS